MNTDDKPFCTCAYVHNVGGLELVLHNETCAIHGRKDTESRILGLVTDDRRSATEVIRDLEARLAQALVDSAVMRAALEKIKSVTLKEHDDDAFEAFGMRGDIARIALQPNPGNATVPQTVQQRQNVAESALMRDIDKARANYEILMVNKLGIPAGTRLSECYETKTEWVIIGDPAEESHNCDAMGCSTLSHVVARVHKLSASGYALLSALRECRDALTEEHAFAKVHFGYTSEVEEKTEVAIANASTFLS